MPTLKISYDFLPSHLKQCFAYCCLFPKDYRLYPNELVRLWMAHGFILKSSTTSRKTLHDVGREYFMELASRSFFQDFEKDKLGNIRRCKMHDLMHDLATMVAGVNYTTIVNSSGASHEDIPKEVRHVSMGVDRGSYNLKSLGPNQPIIRSLLFINEYQHINSFSGDISSFRNLRALRLHRLAKGEEDVLRSIGEMKHLRSLDLSWSRELTSLPNSIGKLLNLEMLILYGCEKLESLPREVTKLVNLRHLDMSECYSLTHIPRGIGNLTNLEVLRGFPVGEKGKSNAARMDELRGLTGLREELTIDHLWRVKKESDNISTCDADYFWIDKSRLQRLHLSWGRGADDRSEYAEEVLGRLKPNLDLLKSFTIGKYYPGTTLPSWTGELHNLVEIKIEDCNNMRSIPPLDQLSSLESIELSHCNNMRSIPPLNQLPSLKSISLFSLQELEWIEVTENSICLYLSLEEIDLKWLPMFKGWKRMDGNRSGDQSNQSSSSSLFFIPSFSRKVHVHIFGCPMLCCTWNDYRGVSLQVGGMKYKDLEEELCRRNMSNVEELEEEEEEMVDTQMGLLTFVPLSSVPLHTLTSLTLGHLEDTKHLPMELFKSLSHLQYLKITDCHRMKSPSGRWILRYLRSLESLEIHNCKELDLSSVHQEEDNKATQGIHNSQTKMRDLRLVDMDKMETLPSWIQYLSKLESLELKDCKNIEALPGWFSQLTSLKRLQVFECGELSRRCQRDTGECWPHISHIENVHIQ